MQKNITQLLNPEQRKAVGVIDGPLLILAGAGSGKTRCLTYRTAYLMHQNIPGENILAVTFTNKAAQEMKTRIEKLVTNEIKTSLPTVGTFHATCVRILRQNIEKLPVGISRSFIIFDSADSQNLIKQIIKDHGLDSDRIKYKAVLSHISGAKNSLYTPEMYAEKTQNNFFTQAVKVIFSDYQKKLAQHNALDFDDLLQKTVELFEYSPQTKNYYQNRWKYLMIDEYQDTNFAQYRMMRLLGDGHRNICVIGDDHQSIYSFRGADYTNILNFEKDFPDAQVIRLEQNYRSTKNILKNANALISHNKSGLKKNLWTENEPGEKVSLVQVSDERNEGDFIAQKIKSLKENQKISYCDTAILYRMNAQSRALEEAFMRYQIPYQIIGGTRFFDRKEIKDIIAYLRIIFNPRDDVSFLRIINVPTRKIGPASLESLKKFSFKKQISLFETAERVDEISELSLPKQKIISDFITLIKNLQKKSASLPITNVIDELIQAIAYEKHLDDGTAEGEARIQNVKELLSVANKYDSADHPLESFLEGVALIADIDNYEEQGDKVTLMTIHASKGLEFPVVFLPGWEEGIFPSTNAEFDPEQMEEERRLGYVALTRAQKKCFILSAKERMLFGRTQYGQMSKFINELDPTCTEQESTLTTGNLYTRRRKDPGVEKFEELFKAPPESRKEALWGIKEKKSSFSTGQKIQHAEFGTGTILRVSGDVLSISFKEHGFKKIVGSVAPIEVLS